MPKHIRSHMEKVAQVAVLLGLKIKERGFPVQIQLLRQACLLHDIVKVCEISNFNGSPLSSSAQDDISTWEKLRAKYRDIGHVRAASEILEDLGEHEIAQIILKHRFDALIDENASSQPVTWEEKLLYYADKRVRHDRLVTIKERLEDGRRRYFPDGNPPPNDVKVEKALYALEKEICKAAGIKPSDLDESLSKKK